MHRIIKVIYAGILVCGLLIGSGCSVAIHEGFAIYLTKGGIAPSSTLNLNNIGLAEPIVTINDVISYNAQTHELKLTAEAFRRISDLEVPIAGKSFVVCVDGQPIYWGAFWTPISSIPFDGVTIWKPYNPAGLPIVTLELGYPSSSFYGGDDPRNRPEILKSLEREDKLVTELSLGTAIALPHSMKGYDLYSWFENGQWHFTLITGTNRNKTIDEIIANEDYISESGWVKVSVIGIEQLRVVLSKLPANEFVTWIPGMIAPSGQTNIVMQLPPKQTYEPIEEYALQRTLNLQIQGP